MGFVNEPFLLPALGGDEQARSVDAKTLEPETLHRFLDLTLESETYNHSINEYGSIGNGTIVQHLGGGV